MGAARSYADPDVLPLAQLAYDERFLPWRARIRRFYLRWVADSAQREGIRRVFRTGVPWSDIPTSQVALADFLLGAAPSDSLKRASIHEGKAIALMALGRPRHALAQLDSATGMRPSDAASLQQAEWRVVLPALGLPISGSAEWRGQLIELADDALLGARAAWALGLAAYVAGDTSEGHRWRARLRSGQIRNLPLERFLDALALAGRHDWRGALGLTDSLEVTFNAADAPDPFARAAFHLHRGVWFAAAGDFRGADREWLWYEASDIEGWPQGPALAGEIDGMLGVYARLLRGEALLRPGAERRDRARGCAYLKRVVQLWDDSEVAFEGLLRRAETLQQTCSA